MSNSGLSRIGLIVGTAVTTVWAGVLSVFVGLFDSFSGELVSLFTGYLFPILTLGIPAGIVVGLIGGKQLYIESGLAAVFGYLLSVLVTLVYDSLIRGDPTAPGRTPELLIGFFFALLVGLVLLPAMGLIGGYTARTVRGYTTQRDWSPCADCTCELRSVVIRWRETA